MAQQHSHKGMPVSSDVWHVFIYTG